MDKLAVVGLLVGFTWGTAGILRYPNISWKPGAVLTVACAAWLVSHEAMPPEPLIEAGAIFIFIGLMIAQKRLFPAPQATRTDEKQG